MKFGVRLFVIITAALLLGSTCSKDEQKALTPEEIRALNSRPQAHYPELTIEQQRAAMARLEAYRAKTRIPDLRKKVPPADWIALAYHGLLLDANYDVIPTDPETLATIQQSLYFVLQAPARERMRSKYGSDPAALFGSTRLRPEERAFARAAVLDALIDESDPEVREKYEWRLRLVQRGAGVGNTEGMANIRPQVLEQVRRFQIADEERPAPSPPPTPTAPTYVEQCRAGGVPIPPNWPDARWISQGPLALVLISTNLNAEVFAYKDPAVPGACYALPRHDASGSIELLGIICQSSVTGNACFWDNKTPDNVPIKGPNITLDIDSIANGLTLAENCTNCHRGENVFIIHPGTALEGRRALPAVGGPYDTTAATRYTPIGQTGFVNPPALTLAPPSAGQGDCTDCHTIPETQPKNFYCQSVLWGAALETMPPFGSRAGWPPAIDPFYLDHITQLSQCP